MTRDEIAVIIPCYNEALTIGKVIDDFCRELPEASVYVYDNNSTDETARASRKDKRSLRQILEVKFANVCEFGKSTRKRSVNCYYD